MALTEIKMDQEHYERMEEDYMYLSVSLRKNIKRLVSFLVEKETINEEQAEDILDEASNTLKSQTLLDIIMKDNEAAFEALYEGSLHSQLWRAADILKPENGPHQPKEEDIEEFLPESWPTESHIEVMKDAQKLTLKKIGPKHARMVGFYDESRKGESSMYDMSQKIRGKVLIINNETFHSSDFPPRKGSEYDRLGLDHLFSQLGFEITTEKNKTEREMMYVMEREARKNHSEYKCFILIILSYGYEKIVFGTDGKMKDKTTPENGIPVDKIKELYSKVKSLVNKPKVILIEAQQGRDEPFRNFMDLRRSMEMPELTPPSYYRPSRIEFEAPRINRSMDLVAGLSTRINQPKHEISLTDHMADSLFEIDHLSFDGPPMDDFRNTAPTRSDIFEAISTPGGTLYHNEEPFGSWFMQALIYVLANYSHQNDLATIIEKANTLVRSQRGGIKGPQVCSVVSTLNRKLYFFPGLPIEG